MSLVNTRLQNFRATTNIDKNEVRGSRNGALELFKMQSEDAAGIVTDDLRQKAIAAVGSTLEIPVLDFEATTIQNVTQPLVIAGDPSTSQLMAVTFTHFYFGFRIFPALHQNNEISMQREFNRQMTRYITKLAVSLDAAALAALEASKTQVLTDDLGGRYSLTSNVVVAPLAEQNAVIGDINPIMHGNDFYGPFDVVANPSMESHVRNNLLEQGQFNNADKTYQYNDKTFLFSNGLANAAGHKATAFAVEKGSVGMIQQFGADNLMGNATHKHQWGIETLPMINLPVGTFFYDDAIDGSSLSGAASAHLTATKAESYGFHTAVAFLTPYNSDAATIPSAVAKVAIATA